MQGISGQLGPGESLYDWLKAAGRYVDAACGGRGSCGKCRVTLLDQGGQAKEEVLACRYRQEGPFTVSLPVCDAPEITRLSSAEPPFYAAVDLGTTNIVATLLSPQDGMVLSTGSVPNRQRLFGADVMSRMQAAEEGHEETLKALAREDVETLLRHLAGGNMPEKVALTGNTVMQHLYRGLPVKGLLTPPFTPVTTALETEEACTFLPGIGAYTGADLLCGIAVLSMGDQEELTALLDIGTNGEIAVGNRDGIVTSAAAAGPAFENAGVGRGSEVVSMVYDLLTSGRMDETGLLLSEEEGVLTQKDIRDIQLAKAAIRAGLLTCVKMRGASLSDIKKLYIAGAFGTALDPEKAAGIGLIPKELVLRTEAVGNTALLGAQRFLSTPGFADTMRTTKVLTKEISLAEDAGFSTLFMKSMRF